MDEKDPFKDYYDATFKGQKAGNTAKEIIAALEAKEPEKIDIKSDADTIRDSINAFIRNINVLVSRAFEIEAERKTRTDLVVTMVIGGLAYTMANLYYLIVKRYNAKMTTEEFEATFMGMFQTALKDLGKGE
jgi:nitrate/nitrite-specific signal transduction histidine kinase